MSNRVTAKGQLFIDNMIQAGGLSDVERRQRDAEKSNAGTKWPELKTFTNKIVPETENGGWSPFCNGNGRYVPPHLIYTRWNIDIDIA